MANYINYIIFDKLLDEERFEIFENLKTTLNKKIVKNTVMYMISNIRFLE